ncbi:MAG: type II methionyl aminopeptidase [Nanoarchaeota archaeon]|nr:type II methionyl aminopeptidase [Nanoarchaeota archaeon]
MQELLKAGKITAEAREYAKSLIKEEVNVYDFVKKVEDKIFSLGGKLAFPVNISINEDAAHDTADYKGKDVFTRGQVVKVDIGAQVNGYVGDTAFTKEITTNNYKDLIKASEEALKEALKIIKPGIKLCEIGAVIESTIKKYGYNPIRNLGGHGVSKYNLHTGLFIPNYDNGSKAELKEDDTVAVEPFATTGHGMVFNKNIVKIFSLEKPKPTRVMSARKMQDYIIKEFNTLPFAEHHLKSSGKFSEAELRLGLRELVRSGILHSYHVLTEVSKGIVSQAEHTIIVNDDLTITTE